MIKQAIAIVVLSIVVILFMSYSQQAVQLLVNAHHWIAQMLTDVFTGGQAGNIARGLIALLSIPLVVALVPTLIYWIVRKHWFPYFMQMVWVVWLIQVGAILVTAATA